LTEVLDGLQRPLTSLRSGTMIEFLVGNSLTRATTDSDGDALIDSVLRYKVPSYEIIKRKLGYAAMRWDGTKSFYSRGLFLTGLLGKPFFKFFEISEPARIKSLKSWRDVYERGIVYNKYRNTVIAKHTAHLL
jgi:hypothetical protein